MASNGDDFSLELVVGLKDMFTQSARKIEKEIDNLDKQTKKTQATFSDVSAYNKSAQALEKMTRSGDSSAREMKEQERVVDNLSQKLRRVGVNAGNAAKEQERLRLEVKRTNEQLKAQQDLKDLIVGGLTSFASGATLKALWSAGNEIQMSAKSMARLTNYTPAEINSQAESEFRKQMASKYNVELPNIIGTQAMFNQQARLKGKDNQSAVNAALRFQSLTRNADGSEAYSNEEIVGAMSAMIRKGVTPEKSAALMYKTFREGGDVKHDLLDTVQEYYGNLASRGMKPEQFFAQLIAGQKNDVFNYDKIADSMKETFTARLSDPAVIGSIVGHDKTPGAVKNITDTGLRQRFKNAIYRFQENQLKGKDTTGNVGEIYQLLGEVKNKSPMALQPLSTLIGGTMLTEDSGADAASAMGKALLKPGELLGNYDKTFNEMQGLLTRQEDSEAAKKVATQGVGEASNNALKNVDGLTASINSLSLAAANFAGAHPGFSSGAVMGTAALAFGAGIWGKKRMIGAGLRMLGIGGSEAAATSAGGGIGGWLRGAQLGRAMNGALEESPGMLGRTGRGIAGALGGTAKGIGSVARFGGKALPWLGVAAGGYDAWNDYQKGDMKGVAGDVAGTGGALAGAAAGAAAGSIVPVFGTAIGALIGGAIGEWGGDKIGEGLYSWLSGDKSTDADKQLQALTPGTDSLSSAQGGEGLPPVEFTFSPQIEIQALSAAPEEISKSIEDALRQSTPELMQALQYALEQVMNSNDHLRPSQN